MPERDEKDTTFVDLALNVATADNTSAFGQLVDAVDDADLELKAWPQRGMQAIIKSDTSQSDSLYYQRDIEVSRDGAVLYTADNRFGNGGARKSGQAGKVNDRDTDTHVQTGSIRRHPGNGIIYHPKSSKPFILLLAPDKGDVKPSDFQAIYFRGNQGFHVSPGVWHQYPYPVNERTALFTVKESKVFASETIDFSSRYGQEMRFPVDHAHIQALLGSDVIPDLSAAADPVTKSQPADDVVSSTATLNAPVEIHVEKGEASDKPPTDTPRSDSSKMSDVFAELVAATNDKAAEQEERL